MGTSMPDAWAEDKRDKMKRYLDGDVGRYIVEARDVMMRGVPTAALAGFTANGEANTTGWISCSEEERAEAVTKDKKPLGGSPLEGYGNIHSDDLHELGPFGIEGGHVPDLVATGDCAWVSLCDDKAVRKVLGRDGVKGAAWFRNKKDQCVLGVANIARHARAVNRKLDPRLRWEEDGDEGPKVWTLWPFAVASMSWSAGPTGASNHLNKFADELAAVTGGARWGAALRCFVRVNDPGLKHRQDEYSGLRQAQKLAAGILACEFTGEARTWFEDGLGDGRVRIHETLVRYATS